MNDDESKLTWDYVRNALLSDEDMQKYSEPNQHGITDQDALIANQRSTTAVGVLKCEQCRKVGHLAAMYY